jgi:hypothetical protein
MTVPVGDTDWQDTSSTSLLVNNDLSYFWGSGKANAV